MDSYQHVFSWCKETGGENKNSGTEEVDSSVWQQQRHLGEESHRFNVDCSGRLKQMVCRVYKRDDGREGLLKRLLRKLYRKNKVQPNESTESSPVNWSEREAEEQQQFTFDASSSSSEDAGSRHNNVNFFTPIESNSVWMHRFKSLSFNKQVEESPEENSTKDMPVSLWERRMLTPIPNLHVSR